MCSIVACNKPSLTNDDISEPTKFHIKIMILELLTTLEVQLCSDHYTLYSKEFYLPIR